ncbi:hypothetical protein [Aeromonas caviae]|uniref:hypothetical protein n=1 Tax=Aeromonas caviae TaxID=648 RepID=UPI00111BCDD4|nr:hypothetical protein [Aeromonas caviae]
MERQTLQQEAPVYHVCQTCGGEGCPACSDLCILEGEIDIYPEFDEDLPFSTQSNPVPVNKHTFVFSYSDMPNLLAYIAFFIAILVAGLITREIALFMLDDSTIIFLRENGVFK